MADTSKAAQHDGAEEPPVARPHPCPACGTGHTRLSRKQSALFSILKLVHIFRYKCRDCGKRFFAVG